MAQGTKARRTRVGRGIYRQPNGKYAVRARRAGRLHFRTTGADLLTARRAREDLIAALEAAGEHGEGRDAGGRGRLDAQVLEQPPGAVHRLDFADHLAVGLALGGADPLPLAVLDLLAEQ